MRWLAFLLLLPALCFAQEGMFGDGFEGGCMSRWNMGITVAPPHGGSDLKMQMAIQDLPARKGEALVGSLYGQGGTPPYAFSIVSGSLPTGVSMTSGGVLSGTPTTVGLYSFLAKIQDAALGVFVCRFAINIIPALEIVAGNPPVGEATLDYAYQFEISGNTGPVTFAITSGSVPFGFSFIGGLLSCPAPTTPATPSPVLAVITATDTGSGDSIDIPISMDIRGHLGLAFTSWSFPVSVDIANANQHVATFSTGIGPYKFSNFSVPSWMTYETVSYYIDTSIPDYLVTSPQDRVRGSVTFSGIPPAATYPQSSQSFNVTFDVTDAFGETVGITIPVTITNAHALQPKQAGVAVGVTGPLNWNFTGSGVTSVSNDGTTATVTINSGSSLTGDGTTIDIDSAGVVSGIPATTTNAGTISANDYGELQALAHAALGGM